MTPLEDEDISIADIRALEDEDLKIHYLRCATLLIEYSEKYDKLEKAVEINSSKVDSLTKATQGLVDAWTTANHLHKFIKWISSLGALSFIVAWFISKLPEDFFK